jgi:hypothetical protein
LIRGIVEDKAWGVPSLGGQREELRDPRYQRVEESGIKVEVGVMLQETCCTVEFGVFLDGLRQSLS